MPAISLVVCVHLQRDLLERLIRESSDCYDELIVLHDIPDIQNVRSLVEKNGGRFFERPPAFLQEPHWPFAWEQAKNNWILKLDTDEFPSVEMKAWLKEFRRASEPSSNVSGFTCLWPLWNGQRTLSKRWPGNRFFLFHRHRVRFFGMCEQVPIPDGKTEQLNLVLHHQPNRKSYGLINSLFRGQSRQGALFIAECLLKKPTDLVCWRWKDDRWPIEWEQIRQRPFSTALHRLVIGTLRTLHHQWKAERRIYPLAAISGPSYHALICLKFWQVFRRFRKKAVNL